MAARRRARAVWPPGSSAEKRLFHQGCIRKAPDLLSVSHEGLQGSDLLDAPPCGREPRRASPSASSAAGNARPGCASPRGLAPSANVTPIVRPAAATRTVSTDTSKAVSMPSCSSASTNTTSTTRPPAAAPMRCARGAFARGGARADHVACQPAEHETQQHDQTGREDVGKEADQAVDRRGDGREPEGLDGRQEKREHQCPEEEAGEDGRGICLHSRAPQRVGDPGSARGPVQTHLLQHAAYNGLHELGYGPPQDEEHDRPDEVRQEARDGRSELGERVDDDLTPGLDVECLLHFDPPLRKGAASRQG